MSIKCPKCKQPLYMTIETHHTFEVESVGVVDVVPGGKVDEEKRFYLKCMNCDFSGWVDEYHEAANGIVRLFKPGE